MKYTIEDLRNGKCAVINDGTLEELREVLKLAFPYDEADLVRWVSQNPKDKFFFRFDDGPFYYSGKETDLPTQSVKYFIENFKKDIKDSILKSRKSIEDKIKELKELAKSQGMDCDVVLSEKKRVEVEPTPSGMLKAIESISEDEHKKFIPYLAKQIEKYLNQETE